MSTAATLDLENEYTPPAMMREYKQSIEGWKRDAAAYREAAGVRAELDVVYGEKPRQRLDVFSSVGLSVGPSVRAPVGPSAGAPVALFIHGGYWQAMDRSAFSHLARGANERGITVVMAGYTLCPETTVGGIVDELRRAVSFVFRRFGQPITVFGHSAGGHLTACLLATDWRAVDPTLPAEVVHAGLPISGLFDLEPLLPTSLNRNLRLDASEARRLSPLTWKAPAGKSIMAHVGGNESSEFLRQTRELVARWGAQGVTAAAVETPGASHFSVIAPLADPESPIAQDLAKLAHAAP